MNIALGSLAELETQLIISEDLGYLRVEVAERLLNKVKRVRVMLRHMIKVLV